jgi:hypothetical protein
MNRLKILVAGVRTDQTGIESREIEAEARQPDARDDERKRARAPMARRRVFRYLLRSSL